MNRWCGIGRFTKDPDYRVAQNGSAFARFTLACDRRFKRDNENNADFINCEAFGKTAELIDKYFKKGMKAAVEGRIQTGSYKNKEGQTIYTTDIMVDSIEFCEKKQGDGFNAINADIEQDWTPMEEKLPWD